MIAILNKIFSDNFLCAYDSILKTYEKKGCWIINYLYFANISGKSIFNNYSSWVDKKRFKNMLLPEYKKLQKKDISSNYKKALLASDFLLPDWIALQVFYWLAVKLNKISSKNACLNNLNWTDFCLSFFDKLAKEKWKESIQVLLYWAHQEELVKTKIVLEKKGYKVVYIQNWYDNLDWSLVKQSIWDDNKKFSILLVWRTTPDYPIQEIRAWSNLDKICENNLLVFNQWWTFDFWAWKQKRAPKIIISCKLEWLWRLIQDPKRNWKKILNSLQLFSYIFFYLLLKNK